MVTLAFTVVAGVIALTSPSTTERETFNIPRRVVEGEACAGERVKRLYAELKITPSENQITTTIPRDGYVVGFGYDSDKDGQLDYSSGGLEPYMQGDYNKALELFEKQKARSE